MIVSSVDQAANNKVCFNDNGSKRFYYWQSDLLGNFNIERVKIFL